jgi:hypothetical protein
MKFAKWIALAALLMIFPLPARAAGPTVTIDPASLELAVGQIAPLTVKINNVEGLYGFDVKLKFDPAVVEVQDANPETPVLELMPGDFLSYDLAPKNEADNAAGTAWIVVGQVNPHEAQSGSGALFTVYVKGKAAGKTAFEISGVTLANRDGERIDATAAGGQVTVTAGAAAPLANPAPLPTAPAPQIDLSQVTEQPTQPSAPAGVEPTVAPANTPVPAATVGPAPTTASGDAPSATATLAPAAVTAPTTSAETAANAAATAPVPTAPAAATEASSAAPVAENPQAVAQQENAAERASGAASANAAAPAGLDAPTRVSTASQQRNSNTLLFAGGGLLLLAAAGAVGLVVLRRGK